jgi:hypothetical protein
VSYYQLEHKFTHGNAADQIHASSWLTNDLFITADRDFFEVLSAAATRYSTRRAPVFVDRGKESFASQFEEILSSQGNV